MNPLSSLDIRPRILSLLLILVLLFLPFRYWITLILAGGILFVSLILDGPVKTRETFGRILPLLILVILLTPLFTRTGEPFLVFRSRVVITRAGMGETIRMIGRLTGITMAFSLFFHSTRGNELISGLRWFGLPFRAALVINLALRFVPEMFRLYERVKDAHSLREPEGGVRRRGGRIIQRFSRVLPGLTSVLILSIKKINPLAMSLHLRGGALGRGRTSMDPLVLNRKVIFQLAVYLLILGVITSVLVMYPLLMV